MLKLLFITVNMSLKAKWQVLSLSILSRKSPQKLFFFWFFVCLLIVKNEIRLFFPKQPQVSSFPSGTPKRLMFFKKDYFIILMSFFKKKNKKKAFKSTKSKKSFLQNKKQTMRIEYNFFLPHPNFRTSGRSGSHHVCAEYQLAVRSQNGTKRTFVPFFLNYSLYFPNLIRS